MTADTQHKSIGISPVIGTLGDPPTQVGMNAFGSYIETLRAALLR